MHLSTIKKQSSHDSENDRFASRCATMGSQQAFHEHHMNKKRRRKSSDKSTHWFTTTDSGKPSQTVAAACMHAEQAQPIYNYLLIMLQ